MHPEPIATYRLQLQPGFGFDEAAALIPYLVELGVSHLYLSPYLQAAPGSTHGYDVIDPTRVNEELGGPEAHARLMRSLKQAGLGQMLDVVPNHMAISGRENSWWWSVLENGHSSRYATYFDVDWETSEERWPNKILLPVLGDHYGRVLEAGQLSLRHHRGVFTLHYHEQAFPVDPSSLAGVLNRAAEECGSKMLGFLGESCSRLPRPTVTVRWAVERRHRDQIVMKKLLDRVCREEPETAAAIDAEIARINNDYDELDAFIDCQNYRLALWRTAGRDLGYRRFFDINTLAGLKVENQEVFDATHALPLEWVREGSVQGLRIDHPDGLRDPTQYFQRLHGACPEAWIVVEKILEPSETLPEDWPIAGTTGYDFLNLVNGLFIDPAGAAPLTQLYEDFVGESVDFHDMVQACKRQVLTDLLGSELNRLTALFIEICETHRRYRDYTRHELHEVLREVAVCFPVYRTYVQASEGSCSGVDERYINGAIKRAMAERPDLDVELCRFLGDLLTLHIKGPLENELVMRFQQLTGPAMAKGVEDTAFYRFHRLVSLNEVGGDPSRFGISIDEFHQACSRVQAQHPRTLLASTTHDTKRSEDVRARLALLSEIPERWSKTVQSWASHNDRHRDSDLLDRNTEYLIYQTLVGAWPIDTERMSAYLEKAVREAKAKTSWTQQNEDYEQTLKRFVQSVMHDREFCNELESFVASLLTPGRINSLAQTLLKLTAPGVPDIYQGSELWDLSLVDPDNRRTVDFAQRVRLLAELGEISPEAVLASTEEGMPKLWVIRQSLRLRHLRPELFGPEGSYHPLRIDGIKADYAVAFARGEAAIILVPRLIMGLGNDWSDTVIQLPPGQWRNMLTGDSLSGGAIEIGAILARFPVALLVREE